MDYLGYTSTRAGVTCGDNSSLSWMCLTHGFGFGKKGREGKSQLGAGTVPALNAFSIFTEQSQAMWDKGKELGL